MTSSTSALVFTDNLSNIKHEIRVKLVAVPVSQQQPVILCPIWQVNGFFPEGQEGVNIQRDISTAARRWLLLLRRPDYCLSKNVSLVQNWFTAK